MTRDFVLSRFATAALARSRAGSQAGSTRGANSNDLRGDHLLGAGIPAPKWPLVPAAVLVPLVEHPSGLTVLLTQRASHLSTHAGQIAFPGGRLEPEDEDAVAGALREAEEEVGLTADHVEIIGRLDTWITGTGYEVAPIVGLVRVPYPLKIDPFEVEEAFEVPLDFIVDAGNHRKESREFAGVQRSYFVLPYPNRHIWGATAGMLVNLAEILA